MVDEPVAVLLVGSDVSPSDIDTEGDVAWVIVVDVDDELTPVAVFAIAEVVELAETVTTFAELTLAGGTRRILRQDGGDDIVETDLGRLRVHRTGDLFRIVGPMRELAFDDADLPGRPVTPRLHLKCRPYGHPNVVNNYAPGMRCVDPTPRPHLIGR